MHCNDYIKLFLKENHIIFIDNSIPPWSLPIENGNNEVQSTTGGPDGEGDEVPEATVLAQVAQRCSSKYVYFNDYLLMYKVLLTKKRLL